MEQVIFGIDLGGTTVKMGLFSMEGQKMESWEIPTNTQDGGQHILPDIAKAILDKCNEHQITPTQVAGIGIGVPGPVNKDGIVLKCVNLGWDVFPIAATLRNLTGIPVYAGNDATIAALGEAVAGGTTGGKNSVFVTLGTGVGGGVVVEGNILYGSTGAGGEIGHIHVDDNETIPCNCGNYGCLEQYASATGFVRVTKQMLAKEDTPSSLRDIAPEQLTARDLFEAAKAGDDLADRAVSRCCAYLGKALAIVACTVNPELVIIGGGVSRAGSILIEKTEPVFQALTFHACRGVRFTLATLGNDAGMYGAAQLVRNALSK